MNKISQILVLTSMLILICACESESDLPLDIDLNNGVLIACEGLPFRQNAQLDWYNKQEGPLSTEIYRRQNGEALGEILISITEANDHIYMVLSNSGQIIKTYRKSLVTIDKLTGLPSPRFVLPVNGDKAYVSDASSGTIHVIDRSDLKLISSIKTGTWTEEMVMANDLVFACDAGGDKVLVIDPLLEQIIDSIEVGDSPNHMVRDRMGKIWVHCQGDLSAGTAGGLYLIDPAILTVEQSYPFSESAGLSNGLAINEDRSIIYFLHIDLYRMPIDPIQLPTEPFISSGFRSLYGIGVDPKNGDIWVSDAIDFTSRSEIFRYSSNGELRDQFRTGFNCNAFLFR